MKTIEFELIENNFKLIVDKNGCYFESLLSDNIENLLSDSIKRYSSNYILYNLIIELRTLYTENQAQLLDNKLFITHDDLIALDSESLDNLLLPQSFDFDIKIKDKGIVGYNNFYFQYILTRRGEEIYPKIIGSIGKLGSKVFTLNKYQYEIFKIIEKINNLPENENKKVEIWKSINDFKELSEHIKITLSSLFNKETIVIPSKMSFKINPDKYDNFNLTPIICGINEEEQQLFLKQYNDFSIIQNHYLIEKETGSNVRIIITPQVKDNLQTIKNTPTIRRDKDKKELLSNRYSLFKYPEAVSIEQYSSKVVDFGLYKYVPSYKIQNKILWAYPKYFSVTNISDEDIKIIVQNKEEKEILSEIITNAYVNEQPYFSYNDNLIPFSETNLYILSDLIKIEDIKEAPEDYIQEIKHKTITLVDNYGKDHFVEIDKDIIKDLQIQIENIREYFSNNPTSSKEALFEINGVYYPLTKNNVMQIKSIVEIHLLENLDNVQSKIFDEIIMRGYCANNVEIPKYLKPNIVLKNHQKSGLQWLQNSFKMQEIGRKGVLLADDMGLGKSLQVLSLIFWLKDQKKEYFELTNKKPILIIVPAILLDNWKNEYYKFFMPELGDPLILHGETLQKLKTDGYQDFLGKEYYQITKDKSSIKSYLDTKAICQNNIVITNYETIANYEYSLGQINWSLVVLDEAQKIKNENSNVSQVACKLKSEFRIACTGTPIENSIMDIWNVFKFVQEDLLGPKCQFSKDYNEDCITDEKYEELQNRFYYKKPYAYILRRTKNNELPDLPKKEIVVESIEMTSDIKKYYENYKNEMQRGGGVKSLHKIDLLHQHPIMVDREYFKINDCPKITKLIEILEKIKQKKEKALIFCVYIEMQGLLKNILEDHFLLENISIINGASNSIRQKLIDDFNNREAEFDIMILSPKAAGVGLNIVSANHVIHYGRWWNPAIENQATDRVYRIGQKKDVYVYYLIYKDYLENAPTFDEYLHNMLVNKNSKADNFLIPNNQSIEKEILEEIKYDANYSKI